jgi:hypothetical protein
MSGREFEPASDLLPAVEAAVLDAHRELYQRQGRPWSRPVAYHWLRYEDPDPIARLREGVEKLDASGARFNPELVEKASMEAEKRGFPN